MEQADGVLFHLEEIKRGISALTHLHFILLSIDGIEDYKYSISIMIRFYLTEIPALIRNRRLNIPRQPR